MWLSAFRSDLHSGGADNGDQEAMDISENTFADVSEGQDALDDSDIEILDVSDTSAVKRSDVIPVSSGFTAKSSDVADLSDDSDDKTPVVVDAFNSSAVGAPDIKALSMEWIKTRPVHTSSSWDCEEWDLTSVGPSCASLLLADS